MEHEHKHALYVPAYLDNNNNNNTSIYPQSTNHRYIKTLTLKVTL
jgi:hypothetical protein